MKSSYMMKKMKYQKCILYKKELLELDTIYLVKDFLRNNTN